jgi:hypothetical protein
MLSTPPDSSAAVRAPFVGAGRLVIQPLLLWGLAEIEIGLRVIFVEREGLFELLDGARSGSVYFLASKSRFRSPGRALLSEGAAGFGGFRFPRFRPLTIITILRSRMGRGRVSLGAFGSWLPLILVPAGVALASVLGLGFYTVRQAALMLPIAMAVYYLAWKYVVGFFNRIVQPA